MSKRGIFGLTSRPARHAVPDARQTRPQAGDRLTALSVMYQAERQDKASNVLAGLTLIAAALADLGIAALVLNDPKLPGGTWVPAFLAFPLWVASSFQALLVWSGVEISKSAKSLERQLEQVLGDVVTPDSDARAAGQAFYLFKQPAVVRIQSLVCYGGIWVVIVAFSVICLSVAARGRHLASPQVITAGAVYAGLLVGNLAAWLRISSRARAMLAR